MEFISNELSRHDLNDGFIGAMIDDGMDLILDDEDQDCTLYDHEIMFSMQ